MTKADKLFITIVILLSLAGMVFHWLYYRDSGGDSRVVIEVDGQEVRSVPLRQGMHMQFRIMTAAGYNDIEIDGTKIHVQDADCPDKLCVKSGWAALPSQQLVCLPHKLVVKIIKQGDLDDIAH